MKNFVHLHTHTEYSLLDGASRISKLMQKTKELGMPAIAITDHGVMYGVVDFYREAKKNGVKPIIGCEVYLAQRTRFDKEPKRDDSPYHLVLLAETQEGYNNLSKVVSMGFLEGFYYKPRVDKEILRKYAHGLIALSGCLGGEIPRYLLSGKIEEAKMLAREYEDIFGAGNFYLELQQHGIEGQSIVNSGIITISRELKIPFVATNDIHYVNQEEAAVQDVLLCIQTGKTRNETDRMKFPTDEFYLKSYSEMELLFGEYPEALWNTLEIADRCQVDFDFNHLYLPDFQVPPRYNPHSYLEELCFQGAQNRYEVLTDQISKRLLYELDVIKQMGYSGYFLIVWDLVNYSKRKKIMVGPGRGSAAGSLVAYCLGITDIDPLRYGLLFERFLNPERVSMPDIDIDFCYERRGEVIEYLIEKYGAEQVAQIITFGTMAAKAAVRDVGRVLDMSYADVDRVAKLIPGDLGITIDKALEVNGELRQLYEQDLRVQELLDLAQQLEGMPRHASTHAAGVVISKNILTEHLPVQKTSDGAVTTQFTKETVEEIGLLKMDILGLRTLTVIHDAVENIRMKRNVEIDINDISLHDVKTYEMLSSGNSVGVFQLESSGMRNILKNLKPERFEDLIALVALYRPGPLGSGMVEDFINRKHTRTKVDYLHPDLEPILEETYGVILYQEQVMRIAGVLAGFSMGQADLLRRAMGKKKPEVIQGQRKNFIEGALNRGVKEDIAEQVFDLMEYFAGYGFNKSHSAAYALLAYQTAYLKVNYSVEYMAALLTSIMDNMDRLPVYIEECRRMGLKILPPDINESLVNFTVLDDKIRFGLAAVKNVGRSAIETIIAVRAQEGKFKSLEDFCEKVPLNKRMLESLIKCGAFDSLGYRRSQMLTVMETCLELGHKRVQEKASGQISLFDYLSNEQKINSSVIEMPDIPEFPKEDLLAMEKEMIGFYVSGHPLDAYRDVFALENPITADALTQVREDEPVKLGGIITSMRPIMTRKGDFMAQFVLEDFTDSLNCVAFPRVFSRFQSLIQVGQVVIVEGRLTCQEENIKILCDVIRLPEREYGFVNKLYLRLENSNDKRTLEQLQQYFVNYSGKVPVYLYFKSTEKFVVVQKDFWVRPCAELISFLQNKFGKHNVILK